MVDEQLLRELGENFGFTNMQCEIKRDIRPASGSFESTRFLTGPAIIEITFDGDYDKINEFLNALKVYDVDIQKTLYGDGTLMFLVDYIEITDRQLTR